MALEILELWAQLAAGKCVESPVQIQKYISPGFVFTENVQVNGAYVCKKMAQTMYAGNRLQARGKSTKASWLGYACGCPKIKNCEMVRVAMANWEQCVYSRVASVKRSVGET